MTAVQGLDQYKDLQVLLTPLKMLALLMQVKPETTPDWRKILGRFTDWVCLIVLASAIVSATVPNEGSHGWTSFVLLIIHLNIIVWSGYFADRNAGNVMKESKVCSCFIAICRRRCTCFIRKCIQLER